MAKRYTVEEKRDLAKLVSNLMKEGLTIPKAAEKLNEMGFPMKSGGKWTAGNLSVFRTKNRRYFAHAGTPLRKVAKRKTPISTPAKKERGVSVHTITSILTDPALNSGQIVKMLCAYLEV